MSTQDETRGMISIKGDSEVVKARERLDALRRIAVVVKPIFNKALRVTGEQSENQRGQHISLCYDTSTKWIGFEITSDEIKYRVLVYGEVTTIGSVSLADAGGSWQKVAESILERLRS